MKPFIVHLHLFKNAGTSVEAILEANLGDRWCSYDLEAAAGSIFAPQLTAFVQANPNLRAVSSHQIRRPFPEIEGVEFVPLTFLRHPLDRIQSAHDFDRRRGPVSPNAERIAQLDFPSYIRRMLDGNAHGVSNFQVRVLADAWNRDTGRPGCGSQEHFDQVRDFLRSLPAVGVVDRWDASWAALTPVLAKHFPGFVEAPLHKNLSPERPSTLYERLELMRDRLGTSLYSELLDRNAFDLQLYDEAVASLA